MATFERSSRWLKLALLEIHLALLLLLFPIAAATGLTSGPTAVLTVTCFLLLCACLLTYTWVFIREVHNNRIVHLAVMSADFLVGVFSVVSVVVLYQWDNYQRYDNVIEASVGVAILSILAGLFAVWEMQNFTFKLPSLRRSKNKINVEQAKQGEAVDTVSAKDTDKSTPAPTQANPDTIGNNSIPSKAGDTKGGSNTTGQFSSTSICLKYAWYLFGMSLLLSFVPTEPVMGGGTREVTTLVYLCGVINLSLLFSWVFMVDGHRKRVLHIITAVFTFLNGFLCILTMVLWLISWSMLHTFTPILLFFAGLLACGAGTAVVFEIRQLRPRGGAVPGYLDRQWAASCFTGVLRAMRIDGVTVNVDDDTATSNGNVPERQDDVGGRVEKGPDFTPDDVMVNQQEERMQKDGDPLPAPSGRSGDTGDKMAAPGDRGPPPGYENASKYQEVRGRGTPGAVDTSSAGGTPRHRPREVRQGQSHDPTQPRAPSRSGGMPPVSGMGEEQPRPGYNPFDD